MANDVFVPIFKILWQSKKLFLGVALLTAILSSVVMLLQPNYYKSVCTFYPVNDQLLDPTQDLSKGNLEYYGDDHDIDRLLSIATSYKMTNTIIDKNDLATHYEINTESPKGKLKLFKRFNKHYNIHKTQYDAIELSVEDKDPQKAQEIVLSAIQQLDEQALDVVRGTQEKLLADLQKSTKKNQEELTFISDSLQLIRAKYGIYSTNEQAEAITTLEIKNPNSQIIKRKIRNYNQGLAAVKSLEILQNGLNKRIAQDSELIRQLQSAIQSSPSTLHVIESPTFPIDKSRPRRSLYVLGLTFLATGLAALYILIRHQVKTM